MGCLEEEQDKDVLKRCITLPRSPQLKYFFAPASLSKSNVIKCSDFIYLFADLLSIYHKLFLWASELCFYKETKSCLCLQCWETMCGFLASFVSRMPKHVDNIDLTPGADVKPVPLIYVQEEAPLSLIAAAICLLLILRDRSCRSGQSCSVALDYTFYDLSILQLQEC